MSRCSRAHLVGGGAPVIDAGIPPAAPWTAACRRVAKWIRGGHMDAHWPGWVAAHPGRVNPDRGPMTIASAMHPLLASINEAGMLTDSSQEGAAPNQRAYVSGLLPARQGIALCLHVNATTDYVALPELPAVGRLPRGHPLAGVYSDLGYPIALTKGRAPGSRAIYTSVKTYAMSERSLKREVREHYGFTPAEDLVYVTVFDPTWGRRSTPHRGLFVAVLKALRYVDAQKM